jgi:hypothetical protein
MLYVNHVIIFFCMCVVKTKISSKFCTRAMETHTIYHFVFA